ncbi:MAG: hypothetical protein JRI68_18595 [Deltaproteobacteria bacterium]|nr:hypothetical protein [Deltaproteobacteria bacterium]
MNFDAGQGGGVEQDACADVVVEGNPTIKPADIIFVIDNSCSMNEEINSVEQNINVNFAQIIGASAVDYRIVMVTNHGTGSYDVCIGPPLGPGNCSGAPGNVPNLFYHYDVDVQSHDSLCIIPDTFYGPNGGGEADQHGEYPNGWSTTLRTEAIKVFVEITDDGISCTWNGTNFLDSDQIAQGQTVAVNWDQSSLGHSPGHFGTQANRNYMFYSIVGLPPKSNPLEPYTEFEPVVTGTCQGGVGPGTGYQWLSKGTHGLRFPVCSYQSYDSVFQDIAAGVIVGAQVPCEIEIPEPPPGETYDYNLVSLLWTPGGGPTDEFEQVTSLAACGTDDDKFYLEDNVIKLCPAACDRIEADMEGTLEVKIPCEAISR